MSKADTTLNRLICQLIGVTAGERDMYSYIRDLLTTKGLGVGLATDQVVIDSLLGGNSGAPDLAVYPTKNNRTIKTPDHLVAVFEAKLGGVLNTQEPAIFVEKQKYIQAGTRWFFLLDQSIVVRRNVEYDLKQPPEIFSWSELRNPERFQDCFGVISRNALRLEDEIERFVAGKTRFAYRNIDQFGRKQFISTIREVSQQLLDAVQGVVDSRIAVDLEHGLVLVREMEATWGKMDQQWKTGNGHPIEFHKIAVESEANKLSRDDLDRYQEDHDAFAIKVEPYLYALEIEYLTLQKYAERLGVESAVSLRNDSKASKKVVGSFAYETASLIVSRMLMIRFSEDHEFLVRHISNGGITTFEHYAKHFKEGYQALLRQTYASARNLYRGLFDPSILDWVLHGSEQQVSDALLHAMYLLSRWDFRSVRGDILSGVYDHYLDTSKRRALGEVFTRPEIARYILDRCGFAPGKTLLDPACGSGTFIVEALEQELRRLREAGLMTPDAVRDILKRLCGLDINPFSVSLAQIQVLWHLMDLFRQYPEADAKRIAAELLPAINIQGGLSSLETMGYPMAKSNAQLGIELEVTRSSERRKSETQFPPRFRRLNAGQYDIVVGNPPYVRAHRRGKQLLALDYPEVAEGQYDLYLLFVYRALRAWVKPGGKMGFIVPLAVLEAGYAGALRSILCEFKVIEIVDLELLKKKTFHGVKRPTVILIVENSPGDDQDEVEITTLHMGCYDEATDHVDPSKASRAKLPRHQLYQTTYFDSLADPSVRSWLPMLDYARGTRSEWTTKVTQDDVPLLKKIGSAGRLGSIVATAFQKRTGKGVRPVSRHRPAEQALDWDEVMLIGEGYKLGGKAALGTSGPIIFKGQNIFPGGVMGDPMGKLNSGLEQSANLYRYAECFTKDALFAVRQIAQVPTACRVPDGAVFQNTAYLTQLSTPFPLHIWCMSRIVQFYAAKVMRGSIIEDLGAHWYKRQIALLPIPKTIDTNLLDRLDKAGQLLIEADRDLANQYRHIDALLASSHKQSLQSCFLSGDERCSGINLGVVPFDATPLTGVRESGSEIVADDLLLRFSIPNGDLRAYILFEMERRLENAPDATITRDELTGISVPLALSSVCAEIIKARSCNHHGRFSQCLNDLDRLVGASLDLSDSEIDYALHAMTHDPFLKQVSILWEHRGLRVQAYSDHGDDDRYD